MTSIAVTGLPGSVLSALEALSRTYEITENPVQGGNGYVFKGVNRVLGTEVAIKFYYWGGDKRLHFEPQSVIAIDNAHILKIYDASVLDGEWSYFVTRYCSEGDLDSKINGRAIGSLEAIDLACQILLGLSDLHGRNLLHRDLKPANIYVDAGRAVIGDFGSLARIPDGSNEVPASRHAVLYRPPESISANVFGKRSDIYQVGIVLYQLCGGHLPYNEAAWLSKSEQKHYDSLTYPDDTIYADQCLRNRIVCGRLLSLKTINPWIPEGLVKIIRRACNVDPGKRFAGAGVFQSTLMKARNATSNWSWRDGYLTLEGITSYRIVGSGSYSVQKKRNAIDWRADNSFAVTEDISDLIRRIEAQI